MQHEPWRPGAEFAGTGATRTAPTTVDEASMESSKSFVKALQVSRTPRPDPGSDVILFLFTNCLFFFPIELLCKDPEFSGALVAAYDSCSVWCLRSLPVTCL
jgi:hypothetical protein